MIVEIGHFALVLALAVALVQAALPAWGAQTRDGRVVGRFAPDVKPLDPMIVSAIVAALAD